MKKSKLIFLCLGILIIFFLAVFYFLIWQKLLKIPLPDNIPTSFDSREVTHQFLDRLTIKSAVLPQESYGLSCVESSATHKIYCFGGGDINALASQYLNQIIEYDPVADSIAIKSATLPTGRIYLSCAEDSNSHKIYCFGGYEGGGRYSNQIFEYNPDRDILIVKSATLPSGRDGLSCVEDSATHKIYCFGGDNDQYQHIDQIVEYNPADDTIIIKSAVLPSGRVHLICAESLTTHKIYCFGGYTREVGFLNQIIEYNPATDSLIVKSAILPEKKYGLACAENLTNHKIYCFGGYREYEKGDSRYSNQIVEYDPLADILTIKSTILPTRRCYFSCITSSVLYKIYCFGGYAGDYRYFRQIIEYQAK